MVNLQVLILKFCPFIAAETLPQLLSQPHLHTVVLEGLQTVLQEMDRSHVGTPLLNIRRLHLGYNMGSVISLLPRLDKLSVRYDQLFPGTVDSAVVPCFVLRVRPNGSEVILQRDINTLHRLQQNWIQNGRDSN